MIVDTSALIAILRAETDAERFARALERASARRISAASYLETATVIDGVGSPELSRSFDEFVDTAELIIEPVTEAQVRLARQAYAAYGKGRGHPARLNFGDCFADALAKERGEPLLFKGADFTHTDVASALPTP